MRKNGLELERLAEEARRRENWKRWGPYLSERQWGTVREDYSPWGEVWGYVSHDHARSRAYRWGEDGLLGICDRQCRLAFALALWNERDPILKERLFGLTGPEGNHGEDVKELYYYLDSTPTHSYMKALYKYPQAEFPYGQLVEENRSRGKNEPELELLDTGVLDDGRYFDVTAEYAKAAPDDILIRIMIENPGPEPARLHILPTLWFRNTWSWGREEEGYWPKPRLSADGSDRVVAEHASLGAYVLTFGEGPDGEAPELLFTENETNTARLFGSSVTPDYAKDAFHDYVVAGRAEAVNPDRVGTKAAGHYRLVIPPGGRASLKLRLSESSLFAMPALESEFEEIFDRRIAEAEAFFSQRQPKQLSAAEAAVTRQGYAGLLWSKQFYHYVVRHWIDGDPAQPAPPDSRRNGRNHDWPHLYNKDVISMPDKWEYPWYAAWDLAFHMIPFAKIDPDFAKSQLLLFLREWYMHPNGQLPAYEFAFSDVNPPVHAWAAWRVYKMTARRGERDRLFLARVFHKLLLNFTWWVNRKDASGKNLFSGGFLGLDNIGVFDRSQALPTGGELEQADGTAWMAFFCATLLSMALELAKEDPAYEDVASKFFEHFMAIVDAMNSLGGSGLWNEEDGFYYDQLRVDGMSIPLKTRSMVGIIPLFACEVLEQEVMERLPSFAKRTQWYLDNRGDLTESISCMHCASESGHGHRLLALPTRERLVRVLRYVLDENEFLSPFGIRSLSRIHGERPYEFRAGDQVFRVDYTPGESTTGLFGGNSNWRGPIWFPLNFLLVEALERYHHFYGDDLKVECPTGSGRYATLGEVAMEIGSRLGDIFLPDGSARRPVHGEEERYANDPRFRDLVLFYEYFHGETGRGVGASHQTGWTALVVPLIEDLAKERVTRKAWPASRKETVLVAPGKG